MTAQTKKRCRMEEESIPSITSFGDKLPQIPSAPGMPSLPQFSSIAIPTPNPSNAATKKMSHIIVKDTSQSRSLPSYTHTQEPLNLARCDTLSLNQTALEVDADDEASQDD